MKKKSKKIDMVMKIPKEARYAIEPPPELFGTHPVSAAIHGRPGCGKTTMMYNILKKYKQAGLCDRVLFCTPTAGSNKSLLEDLDIDMKDIFDPSDKKVPSKVTKIVEDERDEFVDDLYEMEKYDEYQKLCGHMGFLAAKRKVYGEEKEYTIDGNEINQNSSLGIVPRPKMKYQNATGGRPNIWMIYDDCISTPVWEKNQSFSNLMIRCRHVGAMPYRKGKPQFTGALGLNNLFLIHALTCERGGLPKLVRQNLFQFIIVGNTANKKELKMLADAVGGQVSEKDFYQMKEQANQDQYDSFIIDFLYNKKTQPSMFRRNLDTFLLPTESQEPLTYL